LLSLAFGFSYPGNQTKLHFGHAYNSDCMEPFSLSKRTCIYIDSLLTVQIQVQRSRIHYLTNTI